MKQKQFITWIFLIAMMLSTTSCGSNENASSSDILSEDTTSETTTGYPYEIKDFGGYTFKILNLDEQYGCYIRLDFDEQTGEKLDDAVYNRNRRVEDRLNFRLEEVILSGGAAWGTGQTSVCNALIQSVMADDGAYDAAYLPVYFQPSAVTDGYVMNLLDIPELHVYDEYWDTIINREMTVNDMLFTASGPLHFMTMDQSYVLLFNQDMMDKNKMEYPYQLVLDGKWTLDKMYEYVTSAVNLNGDESFAINPDGSCVYGIAGHLSSPSAMLYSADVRFYERDKGGISLTLESERMYSALEKIAKICTSADGNIFYNNAGLNDPTGYMSLFSSNRSLFLTCTLKSTLELRNMEATFGLVPMPKYDEAQEGYYSEVINFTEFLVIPKTQDDTSRAGIILDTLTWESYQDVLPVYYDITVSQKGLRNEDSIEMLKIVRDNRGIEFTDIFSIGDAVTSKLSTIISDGTGDTSGASSIVASGSSIVSTKLSEIITTMEENK